MKLNQTLAERAKSQSGFSLTELLVVVLIIASLAALAIMGVSTIRQSARSASCVDNLRKWGVAIHGHAADNNGAVQFSNWANISSTARYYEMYFGGDAVTRSASMNGKTVFHTQLHRRCPAQKWDGMGNGPVGYAMVRPNPKVPMIGHYNLYTASNPSQLLLMMDVSSGLNLNGPADIPAAINPLLNGELQRHRKRVNALFGDGHISTYGAGDLKNQEMLNRWFTLR